MNLVAGIDGHQDRSDLRSRPEGDEPRGDISGPDGNLGSSAYSQRNECTGEVIHVVPEFTVGSGIVKRRIFESILIREFFHHPIEYLGEGLVDQLIFFPYILTRVRCIVVQGLFLAPGVLKAVHIIHEVRENDLPIIHLFQIAGFPLQRDEAVIIDGRKSPHHISDRQRAFPDDLIASVIQ